MSDFEEDIKYACEYILRSARERLYNLKQKELVDIATLMISKMTIKELVKLLTDEEYFPNDSLFKTLEKSHPNLFLKLIDQPEDEKEMRIPISTLFMNEGYLTAYEVSIPYGKRRRKIDFVAYKKPRRLIGGGKLIAVEIKSKTSLSDLDKGFSQANDYVEYSDEVYVAITPYTLLKYQKAIVKKLNRYENIGLIVANKRIAGKIVESEIVNVDSSKKNKILNSL